MQGAWEPWYNHEKGRRGQWTEHTRLNLEERACAHVHEAPRERETCEQDRQVEGTNEEE